MQTRVDNGLCLGHNPIDQLPASGDVVNEARHHAARPGTSIHVPVFHDPRIHASYLFDDILKLNVRIKLALFFKDPLSITNS